MLTGQVKASLVNAKDISSSAIKVVTENNVVYLMGIVTPRESKRAAEIARGVNDVSKVVRLFEVISEDELAAMTPKAAPVTEDRAGSN
jgi:osmotically-inducible protein OsmY